MGICMRKFPQKTFRTNARNLFLYARLEAAGTHDIADSYCQWEFNLKYHLFYEAFLDQPDFLFKLFIAQWYPFWCYLAFITFTCSCPFDDPEFHTARDFVGSFVIYAPALSTVFQGDSAVHMYKNILYMNQQMKA